MGKSAMCRLLPPEIRFSVTAYEKADAQILYVRDREVPFADVNAAIYCSVNEPEYLESTSAIGVATYVPEIAVLNVNL